MSSQMERSIVIRGLSKQVGHEDVVRLFEKIGAVNKVLFRLDSSMNFTGSAFVIFAEEDRASKACSEVSDASLTIELTQERHRVEFGNLLADETEKDFLNSFRKLTPARRKSALSKLEGDKRQELQHLFQVKKEQVSPSRISEEATGARLYQDVPRLPTFSGEPGKEASYGRWKYEVMCLLKEDYPTTVVKSAVRKSLKSPAAEVLRRLGDVSVDQMLLKFQSLYGSVLSGEILLQRFYGEKQGARESCAQWSCRLEDYIYEAIEQGIVSPDSVDKSLSSRFWSGLHDDRIKNALRHREDSHGFTELVMEARQIEEEYGLVTEEVTPKKCVKIQQASAQKDNGQEDKLDAILKRLSQLETQLMEVKSYRGSATARFSDSAGAHCSGSATAQQPWYGQTASCVDRPQKPAADGNVYRNDRSSMRCLKCQLPGHLAFGCRHGTEVACYKCHRVGHIAACCLNC